MKTYFFNILLLFTGIIYSQCSGNFGEAVFTQNFGGGDFIAYGPALPAGYTTYVYRNFSNSSPNLQDGEYAITQNAQQGRPEWHNLNDHSTDGYGMGFMMLVNADLQPGEFYRERIDGLCSGQTYELGFWVSNVLPTNVVQNPIPVNVAFGAYDAVGNIISSGNTGNIHSQFTPQWIYQSFVFEFSSDQPYIDIVLVNNSAGGAGNDLAIDDISLRPCQSQTVQMNSSSTVFTTGVANNSQPFNITLSAEMNSFSNPVYILQQSTDSGTNWSDLQQNNTAEFTVQAGTYDTGDLFRILVSEVTNAGNLNCSVIIGPRQVLTNDNETLEMTVCDVNLDGITEVNFTGLRNQLQSSLDVDENLVDEVYIANSYSGLIKIQNVATNPSRVNVCNSSFSLYEVAVDQEQQVYVSGQNGIFRVNTETCNFQRVGTLPTQSNVAMSFDTQNNLYAGGFRHSRVYRADAGQFNDFYVWHDFGDGSSGGDFVVIGEFMYIAWAYNDDYYLFKVTMDADNQYVSHENLGVIPTDTFGLAAENGRLYGVTPEYLYEINLETLQTNQIIVNSGSSPWWGAAGLHEAVAYEISFHTGLSDAYTGDNPLEMEYSNTVPYQQTVYIRILNENTGEFEIYNLNIIVETPAETDSASLYTCNPGSPFNLTEAIPQMISDSSDLNITYYNSQEHAAAGTNALTNISSYVPDALPSTIYVRFENPCIAINTITLTGEEISLDVPSTLSFCEGESAVLSVDSTFDSYIWTGLTAEDAANNDANSSEIIVTSPGTYTVVVGYGEGCSVSKSIQVTEEIRPVFASQTVEFCAMDNHLQISSSDLISFLNQTDSSYFFELYSSVEDAESGINPLNGNFTVNQGQYITVKVKNDNISQCFTLSDIQIQLYPYPEIALDDNYNICLGDKVDITLPDGFATYRWNGLSEVDLAVNDVLSNQISITQPGTYSVEVANENCTVTREFTISFDDASVIHAVNINGNTATVFASGLGVLEYSLDGISWSSSPVFAGLPSGLYTAYVRGEMVCGISERQFSLFEITNVITPNGDGLNDFWEIKGISVYPEAVVQIYNRYGKLLLEKKTNSDVVWDGTYKGQPVPSSTYWYMLKLSDGRNYSGHITVKNF